jgi:hypothetical protein
MMRPIQVSMRFSGGLITASKGKSPESSARLQATILVRKEIFLEIIPFDPIQIP